MQRRRSPGVSGRRLCVVTVNGRCRTLERRAHARIGDDVGVIFQRAAPAHPCPYRQCRITLYAALPVLTPCLSDLTLVSAWRL